MNGENRINIYIVEDHPIFAEGLVIQLERQNDMHVCGTSATIEDALRKIPEIKPDIIITDLSFKEGISGIELIKKIKTNYPELLFLVLSMHEEPSYIERSIRAGASGYISKSEPGNTILQAIRTIADGKIYLNENINTQLVARFMQKTSTSVADPIQKLTSREFEIFQLIAKGLNSNDIAEKLHISKSTVDVNRKNIRDKLLLKNNSELIHYAYDWTRDQ